MSPLSLVKMEGCGNDYVFLDSGLSGRPQDLPGDSGLAALARSVSHRHYGIGSDGLIVLEPGECAPVRMRMWNADGSVGKLCLNGLRCSALYAAAAMPRLASRFVVETGAGERTVEVTRSESGRSGTVTVEAGRPDFRRVSIPARGVEDELWEEPFYRGGSVLLGYGLSVGNPHLVLWMEEEDAVWRAPLDGVAEPFEDDPIFPEGVNVHLVTRRSANSLVMRSWERGTGATLACGSGAVAAFAVARRLGQIEETGAVAMPGGTVELHEDADGNLVLTGPARRVFDAEWSVSEEHEPGS